MADDRLYTKRVARVMLKMTRHINKDWQAHVGTTGVTCYTCHRGQPVPANVWFKGQRETAGLCDQQRRPRASRQDQWLDGAEHRSVLSAYFDGNGVVRVQATQALPGRLRRADPGDGEEPIR